MTRLARWSGVAALVGTIVVFFHQPLLTTDQFYFRDGLRLSFPERLFMVAELGKGRLPLWFPYEGGGIPFLAQLSPGVLHPLNLVYALFAFPTALQLNFVLSFLLSGLGTHAFLRGRGVGRPGAACGGIAFALSGPLVSQSNLPFLVANSSFPLALFMLDWFLVKPGPGRWLGASAGLGLLLLAGDPQTLLVAGLFALVDLVAQPGADRLRRASHLALAFAGSALLTLPQLLPSFQALGDSGRFLTTADHAHWSFPLARLLELGLPELLANSSSETLFDLLYPGGFAWLPSVFIGPALLLFAAVGVQRDRRMAALGLAGLICLWIGLGPGYGLERILSAINPVWRGFRYPEKLVVFCGFTLCALGAQGLEEVVGQRGARPMKRAAAIAAAALLALLLLVWLGQTPASRLLLGQALARLPLALAVAAVAIALASPWAAPVAPSLRTGVGAILVVAPLFVFNLESVRLLPAGVMFATPWAAEQINSAAAQGIAPPRMFSKNAVELDERTPMPEAPSAAQASLLFYRSLLAPDFSSLYGIENLNVYHPLVSEGVVRAVNADDTLLLERILPTLGVEYLVTPSPLIRPGANWQSFARQPESNLEIFRSTTHLPRTFIARSAKAVASNLEALARLSDRATSPLQSVSAECATQPGDEVAQERGTARLASWEPQKVVIAAELSGPGFLVLNETYSPEWAAFVDGRPSPVCRINGMVRGVKLDAGNHDVRFEYTGRSFWVGLALSALTVLVGAGLALWKRPQSAA